MRLSTSTNIANFDNTIPYSIPFEHAVSLCAGAGYKYIDANFCGMCRKGKPQAPMTLDNWEEKAKSWRKLADDIGVAFLQAHAYFSVDGPILENEVPGGEFGEEMMRRSVKAAQILGVKWMVVHPVTVVKNDLVLPEETYRYNYAYFKRWHSVFKAHGVGMAIENMTNHKKYKSPFADVEVLNRLVDDLGEPGDIGICLDTGHALISGYDPAQCAIKIGKRLKATHIADNHGKEDDHIAPFQGIIDWKAFVKALKKIDYCHDFAFEIHHFTSRFPKEIQGGLVNFSYTLGEYLLSDKFIND